MLTHLTNNLFYIDKVVEKNFACPINNVLKTGFLKYTEDSFLGLSPKYTDDGDSFEGFYDDT